MTLGTILLIVLVLMLIGALPRRRHSSGWALPQRRAGCRAHHRHPLDADWANLVLAPSAQSGRGTLETEEGPVPPSRRHQRTCLKCRILFDSAWAGERVCLRCKTTTIWPKWRIRAGGEDGAGHVESRATRRVLIT